MIKELKNVASVVLDGDRIIITPGDGFEQNEYEKIEDVFGERTECSTSQDCYDLYGDPILGKWECFRGQCRIVM